MEETRKIELYEIDINLDPELKEELLKYAKENITEDALLQWACVDILEKAVKEEG